MQLEGCLAASGLAAAWVLQRLWRGYSPTLRYDAASLREHWRYGLRVYGVDIMAVASLQIDKLFIVGMLSLRDLGLYSVTYGLSRALGMIQNAVASVIFPSTAGLPQQAVIDSVGRASRLSLAVALLASLPLLVLGRPALGWIFGAEFAQATLVLQLLVLEVLVSGTAWVLAQTFNSVGRPDLIVLRQLFGLAVLVTLLLILAPRYGVEGVAIALTAAAFVRLVITLGSFPRALGCPWPRLIPTREDLAFAG